MTPEKDLSASEVRSRAVRGALSAFTRHGVVRLLAFGGTLLLARVIAPATFGVFATSQFVLAILQAICVGGVISALVRRRSAVTDQEFRTAFVLQQALGALAFAALFLASPLLVRVYNLPPEDVWVFRAMAASVFLMSLKSIPNAMLQRNLRHDLVAASDIIEYLTYITISLALAFLGWGIWALVIATLMRHLVAVVALHLYARAWPRAGFALDKARELLRFAAPLQAIALVDLTNRSVAPAILGVLLGMKAVGLVGMANTILDAVILQPLVLLSALQLRLFARIQDDPPALRKLLAQFYFLGGAVIIPLALLLASFSSVIFSLLLPATWSGLGWLIPALSVAALLQVIASPTAQVAKALGEVRHPLFGGLLNLGIQVAVLWIFYRRIGLAAYPLAVAAGALASILVTMRPVASRLSGAPVGALTPVVLAAAAAGLIWLPARFWADGPILLIGSAVTGSLVYVLALSMLSGREVARNIRMMSSALNLTETRVGRLASRVAAIEDQADLSARWRKP